MIEKYIHHGTEVSVISEVKGKHREHCLCFQDCKYFKPNTIENCEIAQTNFNLCLKYDLVTPVYECAKYEKN
jgi:hypothetical protein